MSQFVFLTASGKFVFSEGQNISQAFSAIVADPQKGHGRIPAIVVRGGVAAYVADLFEATEVKTVGTGRNATDVDTGVIKCPLKKGLSLSSLEDLKVNVPVGLGEEGAKAAAQSKVDLAKEANLAFGPLPKVEEAPKASATSKHLKVA